MGVSKNRDTQKWMVENGWFRGTPIFGNTPINNLSFPSFKAPIAQSNWGLLISHRIQPFKVLSSSCSPSFSEIKSRNLEPVGLWLSWWHCQPKNNKQLVVSAILDVYTTTKNATIGTWLCWFHFFFATKIGTWLWKSNGSFLLEPSVSSLLIAAYHPSVTSSVQTYSYQSICLVFMFFM